MQIAYLDSSPQINQIKDFLKSVKENIEVYTNEIMEHTNIRYREDDSDSRNTHGFIRRLLVSGINSFVANLVSKVSLVNDIHTDSDQVLAREHQRGQSNNVAIGGAGQHVRCNLRLSEEDDEDECGDKDQNNTNNNNDDGETTEPIDCIFL